MRKRVHFDEFWGNGWPSLTELEPYFLAPAGKQWFNTGGNDSAGLSLEGVENTEHLRPGEGRITIDLTMSGDPRFGVLLIYSKRGGSDSFAFTSKGNAALNGQYTRTLHSDLMPLWHYISFEEAWKAVKEFIETDGALPKSIEWISNRDLDEDTFPVPHDERFRHVRRAK
jgi:hypothetical protein